MTHIIFYASLIGFGAILQYGIKKWIDKEKVVLTKDEHAVLVVKATMLDDANKVVADVKKI